MHAARHVLLQPGIAHVLRGVNIINTSPSCTIEDFERFLLLEDVALAQPHAVRRLAEALYAYAASHSAMSSDAEHDSSVSAR